MYIIKDCAGSLNNLSSLFGKVKATLDILQKITIKYLSHINFI